MLKKKNAAEAKLNFSKGKKAFENGNYSEAYDNLKKALNFYRNTTEEVILAEIYRFLGEIYFDKGELINSRNSFKRAFTSFDSYKNKIGMADCLDKIALSFMIQGELIHAKEYQIRALKIRKETPDKKGLARGLKNLAIINYRLEENSDKLLEQLEEALALAKRSKDPQLMINIALDKSKIHLNIKQYEEAIQLAVFARRLSKKYSIAISDEKEIEFGEMLLNYGLEKFEEGYIKEALKYLKNSILIFKNKNSPLLNHAEDAIDKINNQTLKKHIKD